MFENDSFIKSKLCTRDMSQRRRKRNTSQVADVDNDAKLFCFDMG